MKKDSRKTIAIAIVLVVAILITIYAVVKAMKNGHQFATEEVSQIANAENEKMLADATAEVEVPSAEKKKEYMEKLSEGWDDSKVKAVDVKISSNNTDGSESNVVSSEANGETETMKIPVPVGYTASDVEGENTVDGGFVIYEGEDKVTGASNSEEVKQAQKERNQWVWVPVYDPSDMYGVDSNGKMWGKLYNFSETGRTNDNWSENDGKITISSKTSDREPDLVSNYDKDDYLSRYLSETDKEQLSKELKDTFEKTIESIKKYGGFYIGRYETGGLNEKAKVVKGDTNISSQRWYTMYEKCKTLKGENRNVETSMIWGCQWDRTLQWLVDTKNKSYKDVGSDSTEWGNYYNKQLQYTNDEGKETSKNKRKSVRIPSGSSETTKANNIYDMAGNVWDWTLEAFSTNSRRYRGGYYGTEGYAYPAVSRYYNYPNHGYDYVRVQGSTLRRPVS